MSATTILQDWGRLLDGLDGKHYDSVVVGHQIPDQPQSEDAQDPAPWPDDATRLCEARTRAFLAKGVPQQQADILASRLMRRDLELDDRRSCAECARFEQGRCMKYRQSFGGGGVEVLHRCQFFDVDQWAQPKRN